jgi:uncharacterized protein (TIGR02421 family)
VKKSDYKLKVLELSERLVRAQKPIRILDAIKWLPETEDFFLNTKFKEIPLIDAAYYSKSPLKFDVEEKIAEFEQIRIDTKKYFGEKHPLYQILFRNIQDYQNVIRMLSMRGTREFSHYSKKLYGSTYDVFTDGETKLHQIGPILEEILRPICDQNILRDQQETKNLTSEDVVDQLQKRLSKYFSSEKINVKLADDIISDASAGSDYIKIKKDGKFSSRDIDIFEVHEGQVHLATTINGLKQSHAKWLAKGPPCTMATQEGLAILMEVFTFVTVPDRAIRINNRIQACHMIEEGANILEVIEFYRLKGLDEMSCIRQAQRAFRGSVLDGGSPFTKDISYCKGFIQVYNFVRTMVKLGRPELLPFLFVGKTTLEDIPQLYELHQEGLIDAPKYVPSVFRDVRGLTVWMAFSHFLNRMKLERIGDNWQEKLDNIVVEPLSSKKAA